ncbi:MAG: DUF2163 domain-containing protein [Pseudomonadota bacterium]
MSALEAHLATGASTTCRVWILRRRDGVVLGFTDHDAPLEVDGVVCDAATGLTAGTLDRSSGLSVDNVSASGALVSDAITEVDLRAGRWDAAKVDIWLVNWMDPEMRELLFRGSFGEITWGDGAFGVELRSLAEALNAPTGRVYQSRCDAVLGDRRCGVSLGPEFSAEVQVTATSDGHVLRVDPLSEYAPAWFERGAVTVLDGAAAGLTERIKTDRLEAGGRSIGLWAALRAPIAAGDRARLEAGCDKTAETCRSKFGNFLNFRGFPDIPGEDWMMAYPVRGAENDGGRS